MTGADQRHAYAFVVSIFMTCFAFLTHFVWLVPEIPIIPKISFNALDWEFSTLPREEKLARSSTSAGTNNNGTQPENIMCEKMEINKLSIMIMSSD